MTTEHGYRGPIADPEIKIKNKGHIRMFNNPVMEVLSLSSPSIITVSYGAVILAMLWLNTRFGAVEGLASGIAVFLAGIFFWTFAEYLLHRYVFHYVSENKAWQRIHYVTHGYHHEYPRDSHRLFMPPLPGAIIAAAFLGLFSIPALFIPALAGYSLVFTAGFVNGYLIYSLVHFATHRFKPPRLFRVLWTHHALHHYKHQDRAFGVSSPFWDHIFRTMPPRKQEQA